MSSQGGRGQKWPILLSKKTIKRGGGGQKLPILRRHSLWTAPKYIPNQKLKIFYNMGIGYFKSNNYFEAKEEQPVSCPMHIAKRSEA